MEKQETIADIIAEMRRGFNQSWHNIDREWAHGLADRIKAAWKRENVAIEAGALAVGGMVEASRKRELSKNTSKNRVDFGQLGDNAKMREALKSLMDNLRIHAMMPCQDITMNHAEVNAMIEDCRAALAAPPRNCDVGTAEEQFERHKKMVR